MAGTKCGFEFANMTLMSILADELGKIIYNFFEYSHRSNFFEEPSSCSRMYFSLVGSNTK